VCKLKYSNEQQVCRSNASAQHEGEKQKRAARYKISLTGTVCKTWKVTICSADKTKTNNKNEN